MKAQKMQAIVSTGYGGPEVFEVQEVEKPSPNGNEVLIKVHASALTRAGAMMRTGKPYIGRLIMGLTKPKHAIPGTGFAGEVEAIGPEVKDFKVGDKVFGESIVSFGTHAEYVCLGEDEVLLHQPANMKYEEGAPICDGPLTVMNFLKRLVDIQPGQSILINGAAGSLGTAAVQIAKHYGAEVTGVCSSRNFAMVKDLGADQLIDYNKTDFVKMNKQYDFIFDTVGKLNFSDCKKVLTKNGVYLSPVLKWSLLLQVLWTSMRPGKKAKFSATGTVAVPKLRIFLQELKEMFALGKLESVIDRRYTPEQIVEAHKYIDAGHKRGNVVLSFQGMTNPI